MINDRPFRWLLYLLTYLFVYRTRVWSLRGPVCSKPLSMTTLFISGENVFVGARKLTAVTLNICWNILRRLVHINLAVLGLMNIWFIFMFTVAWFLIFYMKKHMQSFLFLFCNIYIQSGHNKKCIYHLFANFRQKVSTFDNSGM